MTKKILQQALEALELAVRQNSHDMLMTGEEIRKGESAIEALRSALSQQGEQQPVAWLPSAEWTPCVKLPVTVHVRQQRDGETHVSTREGITPVKPDDLIMRGVSGEEYPIGREIFEKTYRIGEAAPAAQPDWSLLEATQESLCEHMAMVKELQAKLAQQGEQQPVAWYDEEMDEAYTATELDGGNTDGLIPLYAGAAPAAQPDTWTDDGGWTFPIEKPVVECPNLNKGETDA